MEGANILSIYLPSSPTGSENIITRALAHLPAIHHVVWPDMYMPLRLPGESSTDLIFAGNGIIAENGNCWKSSPFHHAEQLTTRNRHEKPAERPSVNTSFM